MRVGLTGYAATIILGSAIRAARQTARIARAIEAALTVPGPDAAVAAGTIRPPRPTKESDPMKRLALCLGLVALSSINAACSGGSAASPAASAPAASAPAASVPTGGEIVVVARNLEFSTASISAPADQTFRIVLDNQESAPHNIAIKDASGAVKFKGGIVSSAKVTNEVPALPVGAYEFLCEVHPDMKGTLTAG